MPVFYCANLTNIKNFNIKDMIQIVWKREWNDGNVAKITSSGIIIIASKICKKNHPDRWFFNTL